MINKVLPKWLKDPNQDPSELYEPDYEKCKL